MRLRRAVATAGARRRAGAAAVLLAAQASLAGTLAGAKAGEPGALLLYATRDGRLESPPAAPFGAVPIGSLAKPFVARGWARAHPGVPPPVARCEGGALCWRASGHGALGLGRAIAVSCNAYFRALAADTPEEELAATLRESGLRPPDPLTPDAAIGLPTPAGSVSATPADLVSAYVTLVRDPWSEGGTSVREALLAGLRDAAHDGTAAGLDGLYAKTGTVPSLDGRALATSGLVVAVDPAGRAYLGLLPQGTGREAARALAARLGGGAAGPRRARAGERMASLPERRDAGRVHVLLFGALAPRRVLARNAGALPVSSSRGFVGAAASMELRPGDRLADGEWELFLPETGLRRLLRGALRADAGPRDALRLRADLPTAEYVAGVLAAELPQGDELLREALGAAVLRFLAAGARHGDADVCDLTHCAWFVGRGPLVSWPAPGRPVLFADPGDTPQPLDATAWARVARAGREPGPDRWTSHCGGEPLPAARVWGGGDRRVFPCPRHRPGDRAAWTRTWTSAQVERAFGPRVSALRVEDDAGGRWRLVVTSDAARRALSWDDAHARLAAVLGWDALPSPADRVVREGGSYRAEGRGRGHRVGLCLGVPGSSPLLD